MYSMHFYTEGGDIEARLANPRFQYLISYHAHRVALSSSGPGDTEFAEDLYQEGMLAAYRLLEKDAWMYGKTLVRLCVLAMYAARRRGRSVLRADPWKRQRTYEQVVYDHIEVQEADQLLDWALIEQFVGESNSSGEYSSNEG